MSRKRDKPYNYNNNFPKRRRPLPADEPPIADDDFNPPPSTAKTNTPAAVVITGLSADCSVLDLKSRFEIYGSISRTRMDPDGVAYITFRSTDAAESAINASLDPSFGITLNSTRVKVMWANDPVPQWREGVRKKEGGSSKLLKPELPLSRHGRGNKLGSAVVNPKEVEKNDAKISIHNSGRLGFNVASNGREIVAYDDIL
ncbi:uncharacterized protein At1g27050 [Rutidosis leptorrhynchoides]|uniref:uncharacterized protein At1g27050 n=1 Tax=Rutidosis leptorrhynchoides TaxID=125765 RepID=UPI003A98EF93